MSVTSCPALVRRPPTTLPTAPAPTMPIRLITVRASYPTASRRATRPPRGAGATSPDPCPHEALHELTLEEEKGEQQRRRRHEGRGGDDRPVHALIAGREHLEADGERSRRH